MTARRGFALLANLSAAILCSCSQQSDPVSKCEAILLQSLKAPASYRRIDQTVGLVERGRQDVFITYDAVNSYNAPLRDIFSCVYDTAAKTAERAEIAADDLASLPDNTAVGANVTDTEPALVDERDAMPADEQDEVPVCDRPDSPSKRKLMKTLRVDCSGE